MNRDARIFCFLVLTIAALAGCSSEPAKQSKKAASAPDKILGKAQVLIESGGSTDAALNAGGTNSVYIWEGMKRYRLFLRTPVDVTHGNMYVAEGVYAQKAIDDLGDPDQGKNGYPLQASCESVVSSVWGGMALDEMQLDATVLRTTVQRHPARAIFLVKRLRPATAEESSASTESKKDEKIPEVDVPAEKQKALLIEAAPVQTAPLWEPAGGKVRCKVIINPEGKISELETGAQLCETVAWTKYRYQPPVQAGHPVRVCTEVEVSFDPRK